VRRGLGRGRTLIGLGAILAICSMPLPWLTVGGIVLSAETASGFDLARRFGEDAATGGCLLMFLASAATLALIVLPFTTKGGQASLDRALSYVVLQAIALTGLVASAASLLGTEGSSLVPTDAPGLWLAIAGVAVAGWGVLELLAERQQGP
jgi:hypothetical protein